MVQVDPIKPTLKAPGSKPLKEKCDKVLSIFAFKFNLSRYTTAIVDERIDKRFEDMETMLREMREEGRAEGVNAGRKQPLHFTHHSVLLPSRLDAGECICILEGPERCRNAQCLSIHTLCLRLPAQSDFCLTSIHSLPCLFYFNVHRALRRFTW